MSGDVECNSEPGQGTKFVLKFPAQWIEGKNKKRAAVPRKVNKNDGPLFKPKEQPSESDNDIDVMIDEELEKNSLKPQKRVSEGTLDTNPTVEPLPELQGKLIVADDQRINIETIKISLDVIGITSKTTFCINGQEVVDQVELIL